MFPDKNGSSMAKRKFTLFDLLADYLLSNSQVPGSVLASGNLGEYDNCGLCLHGTCILVKLKMKGSLTVPVVEPYTDCPVKLSITPSPTLEY